MVILEWLAMQAAKKLLAKRREKRPQMEKRLKEELERKEREEREKPLPIWMHEQIKKAQEKQDYFPDEVEERLLREGALILYRVAKDLAFHPEDDLRTAYRHLLQGPTRRTYNPDHFLEAIEKDEDLQRWAIEEKIPSTGSTTPLGKEGDEEQLRKGQKKLEKLLQYPGIKTLTSYQKELAKRIDPALEDIALYIYTKALQDPHTILNTIQPIMADFTIDHAHHISPHVTKEEKHLPRYGLYSLTLLHGPLATITNENIDPDQAPDEFLKLILSTIYHTTRQLYETFPPEKMKDKMPPESEVKEVLAPHLDKRPWEWKHPYPNRLNVPVATHLTMGHYQTGPPLFYLLTTALLINHTPVGQKVSPKMATAMKKLERLIKKTPYYQRFKYLPKSKDHVEELKLLAGLFDQPAFQKEADYDFIETFYKGGWKQFLQDLERILRQAGLADVVEKKPDHHLRMLRKKVKGVETPEEEQAREAAKILAEHAVAREEIPTHATTLHTTKLAQPLATVEAGGREVTSPQLLKYLEEENSPHTPQGQATLPLYHQLLNHWLEEARQGREPTHPHQYLLEKLREVTGKQSEEEILRELEKPQVAEKAREELGILTHTPQETRRAVEEMLREFKEHREGRKSAGAIEREEEAARIERLLKHLKTPDPRKAAKGEIEPVKPEPGDPEKARHRIIREMKENPAEVVKAVTGELRKAVSEVRVGRKVQERLLNLVEEEAEKALPRVAERLERGQKITEAVADEMKRAARRAWKESGRDPQNFWWTMNLLLKTLTTAPLAAASRIAERESARKVEEVHERVRQLLLQGKTDEAVKLLEGGAELARAKGKAALVEALKPFYQGTAEKHSTPHKARIINTYRSIQRTKDKNERRRGILDTMDRVNAERVAMTDMYNEAVYGLTRGDPEAVSRSIRRVTRHAARIRAGRTGRKKRKKK